MPQLTIKSFARNSCGHVCLLMSGKLSLKVGRSQPVMLCEVVRSWSPLGKICAEQVLRGPVIEVENQKVEQLSGVPDSVIFLCFMIPAAEDSTSANVYKSDIIVLQAL